MINSAKYSLLLAALLGLSVSAFAQTKGIDRKDVIGAAETGSGKTLAFGLPILQVIRGEGGGFSMGLVEEKGGGVL